VNIPSYSAGSAAKWDDGASDGPGLDVLYVGVAPFWLLTSGSNTLDQSSGGAVRKTPDLARIVPRLNEAAAMCPSCLPIGDSAHPSIKQNAGCVDCRPPFGRLGFRKFFAETQVISAVGRDNERNTGCVRFLLKGRCYGHWKSGS
jgi:hypothetical protein